MARIASIVLVSLISISAILFISIFTKRAHYVRRLTIIDPKTVNFKQVYYQNPQGDPPGMNMMMQRQDTVQQATLQQYSLDPLERNVQASVTHLQYPMQPQQSQQEQFVYQINQSDNRKQFGSGMPNRTPTYTSSNGRIQNNGEHIIEQNQHPTFLQNIPNSQTSNVSPVQSVLSTENENPYQSNPSSSYWNSNNLIPIQQTSGPPLQDKNNFAVVPQGWNSQNTQSLRLEQHYLRTQPPISIQPLQQNGAVRGAYGGNQSPIPFGGARTVASGQFDSTIASGQFDATSSETPARSSELQGSQSVFATDNRDAVVQYTNPIVVAPESYMSKETSNTNLRAKKDSADEQKTQDEPTSRGKKMSANRAAEVNRFQDLLNRRKQVKDLAGDELMAKEKKKEKTKFLLSLGGTKYTGENTYAKLLPGVLGSHWGAYDLAGRDVNFTSACIQSMVERVIDGNKNMDVVLFEYSLMRDLNGFEKLLARLRRRFPAAIFIYIHLWSLRDSIEPYDPDAKPGRVRIQKYYSQETIEERLRNEPNARWIWSIPRTNNSTLISKRMRAAMEGAGGEVWKFPMPPVPTIAFEEKWFQDDLRHLSDVGHQMVTNALNTLIRDAVPRRHSGDKSWGDGDKCLPDWYEEGIMNIK